MGLISFPAVVEAGEPCFGAGRSRLRVRLRNGHAVKARGERGAHPPGLEGRVELSTHPRGGWTFIAGT